MRRSGILLVISGVLAFARADLVEAAPVVDRLIPSAGQVGHVVTLLGRDLAGASLEVSFGRAVASEVDRPGGTDRVVRVIVPNKVDPGDPDRVVVTVKVDGVEASDPAAPLYFTYSIPLPRPALSDFTTDDPVYPKSVLSAQPFTLTLSGSNFQIAGRVPQRCIVSGGERREADVLPGTSTDTSAGCSFPGLLATGDYVITIAFSDGSGASILAPGFVRTRQIFGLPPNIESVSFQTNLQEPVECDFTGIVEAYVCSQGIQGARAEPGVFLGGTFTHVRFEVRVTDPDSTPTQSNLLLASASFVHPESGSEVSLVLFDDGAAYVFPFPQKSVLPEDCTVDPDGTCTCGSKVYPLTSGDAIANDEVFTRDLAFVDRGTASLALLQDCVMQQRHDVPIDFTAGATLDFKIEAVDRQGNLVAWPDRPAATIGPGALSCSGDECGCCLLLGADCHGKPGMPSTDFPAGVCLSLF